MDSKFMGLGITKIFGIWLCGIVLTVVAKTVFTKYHVPGLSEVIQSI